MKIGLLGILTVVFALGKMFGMIDWSWWVVLLPAILSSIISIGLFSLVIIGAALGGKR